MDSSPTDLIVSMASLRNKFFSLMLGASSKWGGWFRNLLPNRAIRCLSAAFIGCAKETSKRSCETSISLVSYACILLPGDPWLTPFCGLSLCAEDCGSWLSHCFLHSVLTFSRTALPLATLCTVIVFASLSLSRCLLSRSTCAFTRGFECADVFDDDDGGKFAHGFLVRPERFTFRGLLEDPVNDWCILDGVLSAHQVDMGSLSSLSR